MLSSSSVCIWSSLPLLKLYTSSTWQNTLKWWCVKGPMHALHKHLRDLQSEEWASKVLITSNSFMASFLPFMTEEIENKFLFSLDQFNLSAVPWWNDLEKKKCNYYKWKSLWLAMLIMTIASCMYLCTKNVYVHRILLTASVSSIFCLIFRFRRLS